VTQNVHTALTESPRATTAISFLFMLEITPRPATIVFASEHHGFRDATPPPKSCSHTQAAENPQYLLGFSNACFRKSPLTANNKFILSAR
jgi:hypothetical protein